MLACGVDFIAIERIEAARERFGVRFLDRIFTPAEQAHCAGRPHSLAVRWAAKEAVGKALGCGIGDVRWQEIEVLTDARGAPTLRLYGAAARLASERDLHQWAVSLTHDNGQALAFVVAMG
ncbi:MAG: holo-ACP synthase [Ardenticatenales bacterium]|nr:holo-ACP synthase [Ardenticatenales bacterium]